MTEDRKPRERMLRQHGLAVAVLTIISVVGIAATAGFQLVAIHGLTPGEFGLLASYLALMNVVAIGSSALRSSVAVATTISPNPSPSGSRRRIDPSWTEAVALAIAFALALGLAAPWLANAVDAPVEAVLLTAVAAPLYFVFSRAQGLLQGSGRPRSLVLWTTGSQVVQLGLVAVVIALSLGPLAVVIALLVVALLGAIGSTIESRNVTTSARRAFSGQSLTVLFLTVLFACLINADVVLVRSGTDAVTAGAYASAAVIVKLMLIVPATLGLYLLPRFVARRDDERATRLGVNVVVVVTALAGLALFGLVSIAGAWFVSIIYPESYAVAGSLLPGMTLAWIPWAVAQGILIRITAAASKAGLAVLVLATVAQWIGMTLALPDLALAIGVNAVIGAVVAIAFFVVHLRAMRRFRPPPLAGPDPLPE